MMAPIVTGFVLGLAGSGHCGAMCGPLALLVDGAGAADDPTPRWRRRVAYHAGRLATYGALGTAAGLAGALLHDAGIGRAVALGGGLALIAQATVEIGRPRTAAGPGRLSRALGHVARRVRRHAATHPAAVGVLNGLLPCGLLYAAITAAAATGGVAPALGLMAGFGAGTLPALLGVSFVAGAARRAPGFRRVAAPLALGLAGVMLLLRALAPAGHQHGLAGVADVSAPPAAAVASPPAGHPHHP